MSIDCRSRDSELHVSEIEAIKLNQKIIERMANNSRYIKNYFMFISSAFLILIGSQFFNSNKNFWVMIAFTVFTIVFWVMDTIYLQLEQKFRKHYNAILDGTLGYIDQFDFNPKKYKTLSFFSIMLRPTLSLFYLPIIIILWVINVNVF